MFIIGYALLNFLNLVKQIIYLFFNLFRLDTSILKTNIFKPDLQITYKNNLQNLDFKLNYLEYKWYSIHKKISFKKFLINEQIITLYLHEQNYLRFLYYNLSCLAIKLNLNYFNYNLNLAGLNNFNNLNFKKFYTYKILKISKKWNKKVITISDNFFNKINNLWVIKYAPSNYIKYISLNNISNYKILYLRKNKVFNKGRYSRNRQYYRTGVYWCLYVNIVATIGIHFWFYKLTMNFGYMWWLLFVFIASFIIPKSIKFRLYNFKNLYNTYIYNFIWLYNILNGIFISILLFLTKLFKKVWAVSNFEKRHLLNNICLSIYSLLYNRIKFNLNSFYKYEYNLLTSFIFLNNKLTKLLNK